jgi:hypothetical protein
VDNLDGQLSLQVAASAPYGGVEVPTAWSIALPGVFHADIRHIVPLPDIPTTAGQVHGAYFEGPAAVNGDDGAVAAIWAEHFNGKLYSGGSASPRL